MADAPKSDQTALVDPFNVPTVTVDGVAGVSIMNGAIDATLAHIRSVPAGGLDLQAEWIVSARLRLSLQAAIDLRDKLNAQIGLLTIDTDVKPN